MLEKIRTKIEDILEDGEFVDEEQTEILTTSFAIMRLLRISPQPGKKLTKLDFALTATMCFPFLITTSVADLIGQFYYQDFIILDDVLNTIATAFSGVNMYLTMAIFAYKNREIIRLARAVGCFREFRKPASFDRANRFGDVITKAMTLYTICGNFVYALIGLLRRPRCLRENAEWGVERPCGLMIPARLPAYLNEPPYVYVVLLAQVWNSVVMCTIAGVVVTFVCGLVALINARVRLLKDDVRAAFACASVEGRRRRLNACVRHHVYLIDVVGELNACVRHVCLVQSSLLSVVIALIAYEFLVQPELRTFLHGAGWLVALAILCRGGQALIDESADLAAVLFHANWFDADVGTQKMVVLMIAQANCFFYLDTTFFGPLALYTFSAVIQNAYSFVAFLYS